MAKNKGISKGVGRAFLSKMKKKMGNKKKPFTWRK